MRVLLVGGGAREHAIGEALAANSAVDLLTVAQSNNPGLKRLSETFVRHSENDVRWVSEWAREQRVELAVIGSEEPLGAGLVDALEAAGIATVGPRQGAAQLETSKLFTRALMERHGIPGRVEYHHFADAALLERFLLSSGKQYALKPVGLTAGKGVKVMGVQLTSVEEAIAYGRAVIDDRIGGSGGLVVEERLIGEEFSLQAWVDGETIVPMPLVRDYKLAYEGDTGPNTGSMGSYSQPDGLLPYVTASDRDQALGTLKRVIGALRADGIGYRGIIYGQFMMTVNGPRLVEINARFGDPEAMNVLALLESDLADLCTAMTEGRLSEAKVTFSRKATVCKYVTPPGYPDHSRSGLLLRIDLPRIEALGVRVYFAKVEQESADSFRTMSSRAIALVGRGDTVMEAEKMVEAALGHVTGEYHLRHDIGTQKLIQKSVENMQRINGVLGVR